MYLVFKMAPRFFAFAERPSFVEIPIMTGLRLRMVDLAAIRTGPSVIPYASLAKVFPVHGAITNASRTFVGPKGSTSATVRIGSLPVIRSRAHAMSAAFPNLVF